MSLFDTVPIHWRCLTRCPTNVTVGNIDRNEYRRFMADPAFTGIRLTGTITPSSTGLADPFYVDPSQTRIDYTRPEIHRCGTLLAQPPGSTWTLGDPMFDYDDSYALLDVGADEVVTQSTDSNDLLYSMVGLILTERFGFCLSAGRTPLLIYSARVGSQSSLPDNAQQCELLIYAPTGLGTAADAQIYNFPVTPDDLDESESPFINITYSSISSGSPGTLFGCALQQRGFSSQRTNNSWDSTWEFTMEPTLTVAEL